MREKLPQYRIIWHSLVMRLKFEAAASRRQNVGKVYNAPIDKNKYMCFCTRLSRARHVATASVVGEITQRAFYISEIFRSTQLYALLYSSFELILRLIYIMLQQNRQARRARGPQAKQIE